MTPTLRTCPKGHRYLKSSDCPTCPQCEAAAKPASGFLGALAAPAFRALRNAGLTTLPKLSKRSEEEILALHGMGPASLPRLRAALKDAGLSFREGEKTAARSTGNRKPSKRTPIMNKTLVARTIPEYIELAPAAARKNLEDLYAVLRKVAPQATEAIKWRSPVFEEGRILFAFMAAKAHANFVPTPATMAEFKEELKPFKTGKGTIQFPHDRPIPRGLVRKIAMRRLRDVRENDAKWM